MRGIILGPLHKEDVRNSKDPVGLPLVAANTSHRTSLAADGEAEFTAADKAGRILWPSHVAQMRAYRSQFSNQGLQGFEHSLALILLLILLPLELTLPTRTSTINYHSHYSPSLPYTAAPCSLYTTHYTLPINYHPKITTQY